MFLNSCHLAHTPFVVLFCHALLDYFICSSGWSLKVLYCLRLTVLWNNRSDEVMEIITVSLADLKKVMKHSVTDANSETFVSIWDWFTHEKSSRLWHDTVSTYNVWTWHNVNIQRLNMTQCQHTTFEHDTVSTYNVWTWHIVNIQRLNMTQCQNTTFEHDTLSTYNVWTWHSVNIQRSNSYRSRRELYPSLEI